MFQHPECSKMVRLWYENHILALCWPSEIVSKSMPKRLQNQLYVGYPLGTLKNTIFDVKTSPRRTPKISDFFQKSTKKSSYYGLWSKMPLGSLQEPSKRLPRASQAQPFFIDFGSQLPSHTSRKPPKDGLERATISQIRPKPLKSNQNQAKPCKTMQN